MKAVQAGDQAAFETLVGRHIDALYNYALRLGRSPSLADDLVQDTWLAVWQKAHRYRPGRAQLATWLHRILHNRFIDLVRKEQASHDPISPHPLVAPHDAESDLNAQRAAAALDASLGALPENQRAALLLVHAQGFTAKQTSKVLGTSVRAVESLLARARRNLRTSLTPTGDPSHD